MAEIKRTPPVTFQKGLTRDQIRLTKHLGDRKVKASATCKKDEVEGVVDEYFKKGYKLDKNRRRYGLCFLSFSKSI